MPSPIVGVIGAEHLFGQSNSPMSRYGILSHKQLCLFH